VPTASQSPRGLYNDGLTLNRNQEEKKQSTVETLILLGFDQIRVAASKRFWGRNAGIAS
jgi:hypothetical protein